MKNHFKLFCICLSCWVGSSFAFADTLLFSNNETANGIILRTNASDLLVLSDYGTVNWPRATIKTIIIKRDASTDSENRERLPRFKNILLLLNKQTWAT